jgi:hypothetical protein
MSPDQRNVSLSNLQASKVDIASFEKLHVRWKISNDSHQVNRAGKARGDIHTKLSHPAAQPSTGS